MVMNSMRVCLLLLVAAVASTMGVPMNLHMMPDKGLKGMGAVCLDGSDAGFYFAPATSATGNKTWQLYFQGGGWCYDERDCLHRSKTTLGSSKQWGKTISAAGIMSDDCSKNPDFCDVNRVFFVYCDGNSFSGNRADPVRAQGGSGESKLIYFRGKRVLDAILDTVLTMGLASAESVLLTGCSAGGLATYLHADYVHERLQKAAPSLKKFRAAPLSGFFLRHNTLQGKPVYADEIKAIFNLANATSGVNQKCIAAKAPEDQWMCNFADESYRHTETNIFVLNSALDSWQTACIYAADYPAGYPNQTTDGNGNCSALRSWAGCAGNVEHCNATQVKAMNQYMHDFTATLQGEAPFRQPGNGAFIVSCHTHCEANEFPSWNVFAINGISMQQAFSKWWKSEQDPADKHTYIDCTYHADKTPHACNPSCTQKQSDDEHVLFM